MTTWPTSICTQRIIIIPFQKYKKEKTFSLVWFYSSIKTDHECHKQITIPEYSNRTDCHKQITIPKCSNRTDECFRELIIQRNMLQDFRWANCSGKFQWWNILSNPKSYRIQFCVNIIKLLCSRHIGDEAILEFILRVIYYGKEIFIF